MNDDQRRRHRWKRLESESLVTGVILGPDEHDMADPREKYEWIDEPEPPSPMSGESVHLRGKHTDETWKDPDSLY